MIGMKIKLILLIGWCLLFSPVKVGATENRLVPGKIERIIREEQSYQELELLMLGGDKKGEMVMVVNDGNLMANAVRYETGDKVLLSENGGNYIIIDYARNDGLIWLTILFVVLILVVARWKGLGSLLGMGFTFLVLFGLILPKIADGGDPMMITTVAVIIIIPFSFVLSHGFNKKTAIAIGGSLVALVMTVFLANFFILVTKLSGFSSEEAGMLSVINPNLTNMKGLLLAGIIIGALGVLDDITISQAAIVAELVATTNISRVEVLYTKAMNIGKDHIASMVNTLLLAYAGASLPLLLIFINNPRSLSEIINYEMIAEEIVRTLVGSIALVAAVPVTTVIAAYAYQKEARRQK